MWAPANAGLRRGDRLKTDEADIVLNFNVGDTLIAQTIRMSSRRSTKPHNFTVAGLDIDLNLDEAAGGRSEARRSVRAARIPLPRGWSEHRRSADLGRVRGCVDTGRAARAAADGVGIGSPSGANRMPLVIPV